jgi:Na+/melibiose symporter-like transporter
MIIGITISKWLADKYGKRDVFGIGLFISTLFILLFYFFPPKSVGPDVCITNFAWPLLRSYHTLALGNDRRTLLTTVNGKITAVQRQ